MATLPTEEQNGRLVLDIYSHFRSRPGHLLRANNFIAVAARRHIPVSDLKRGIDYAVKEGWIKETPDGWLSLTEEGFQEMQ